MEKHTFIAAADLQKKIHDLKLEVEVFQDWQQAIRNNECHTPSRTQIVRVEGIDYRVEACCSTLAFPSYLAMEIDSRQQRIKALEGKFKALQDNVIVTADETPSVDPDLLSHYSDV